MDGIDGAGGRNDPEAGPAEPAEVEPGTVGLLGILRETMQEWSADGASTFGAALAYYTLFSLAPLLLLVIAIVGLRYGTQIAQSTIVDQIQAAIGPEGAKTVKALLVQASRPTAGITASAISLVTMFFGATAAFGQLRGSLRRIFDAPAHRHPGGLAGMARQRALAFAMILALGAVLTLSLVASAVLSAMDARLAARLPVASVVLSYANFAISFLLVGVLFMVVFKVLPESDIGWRDAFVGGLFTAGLFGIGKWAIALYLGRATTASVYGAAGSLVLLLLWIYYSAQILFFGAELTEVWSRRRGSRRSRPRT